MGSEYLAENCLGTVEGAQEGPTPARRRPFKELQNTEVLVPWIGSTPWPRAKALAGAEERRAASVGELSGSQSVIRDANGPEDPKRGALPMRELGRQGS